MDITKKDILDKLTALYYECDKASVSDDDGWSAMARAISIAEDHAITEIKFEEK